MTFLAPMAGIVAAAIGVPVLIALYLLKLRRRPLRVSSTLLWERAVQDLQANAPLRWLRPSWLLLLQLLALATLAVAIARPALPGAGPRGSRVVLLIDRSASMSAVDGVPRGAADGDRVTRLDQAKALALEFVEQMRRSGRSAGRSPQAMVVEVAAQSRAVTAFTSDRGVLREAIEGIEPTDQPGNLSAALSLLQAAAARPAEEGQTGEPVAAYLFSDGGFERAEPQPAVPAGVALQLMPVGPAETDAARTRHPDNLGIVAINARRDYQDPATVRVFVRVQNAGAEAAEAALRLRVDGDEADRIATVEVPGATRSDEGVVTPGEAAATFQMTRTRGGVAVVTIARQDLLPTDNSAGVALQPAREPRVLVVGPGGEGAALPGAARDPSGADPFLLGVLEALDLGELRTVDAAGYENSVRQGAADGDPRGAWSSFDLIVFDRVRPSVLPRPATLSFGAGLPLPGLAVERPEADQPTLPPTRVVSWRRTHPLLRYAGLDPLVVAPPLRLRLPEPGSEGVRGVEELALGVHGPLLALIEDASGARRVVAGFDLVRTNWGPDVSFPIFVSNAVEFLSGRGDAESGRSHTTGEPITVRAAPGVTEVAVEGPVSLRVPVPPGDTGDEGREVSLGLLELAGIYRVSGVTPRDQDLAVNLVNPLESSLVLGRDLETVAAGGGRGGPPAARADPVREIWHWFVALALVLLTIDWFVYAWRSRL